MRVDVFDEDTGPDDPVAGCAMSPVTADQLHAGIVVYTGPLGTISVGFLTQ